MRQYRYHNTGNAGREFSRLDVLPLPPYVVKAIPEHGVVRVQVNDGGKSVALNREQVEHLRGILDGVLALNYAPPKLSPALIEESEVEV